MVLILSRRHLEFDVTDRSVQVSNLSLGNKTWFIPKEGSNPILLSERINEPFHVCQIIITKILQLIFVLKAWFLFILDLTSCSLQ